jgi:hypothetical protein
MALRLLGEPPIDIHCGGVDLIFPHHENEIAQSEGATNRPFARFWMHVEHLLIDGMSLSQHPAILQHVGVVLAGLLSGVEGGHAHIILAIRSCVCGKPPGELASGSVKNLSLDRPNDPKAQPDTSGIEIGNLPGHVHTGLVEE